MKNALAKNVVYTLVMVFLASYSCIPHTVQAAESSSTTKMVTPESSTTSQSTRTPEVMPQSMKEYQRSTLDTRTQERIMNLGGNIRNRIHALMSRFEGIAIRLESRMNKIEQEGYSTTQTRALIAQVYAQLEITKVHLAKLDALPALISSDTPRASFAIIREEFRYAEDSLRKTHTLLGLTVHELQTLTSKPAFSTTTTTAE